MSAAIELDELLMAHAAGRLAEPVALVVASHLFLSPVSRGRYRFFEAAGGALLDKLEPEPVQQDGWGRMSALLDMSEPEPPPVHAGRRRAVATDDGLVLPLPLRAYLPGPVEALPWRNYGPVAEADLPLADPEFRTRLIRLKAGRSVPRHTHEGNELTLVLHGSFHDIQGHYRRGDLAIADAGVDHQPTADADGDCLCLAVTDAPLRLTGSIGRLLNPFLRL
ncbi:ChrR family anti-sigma-E factor [Geminicoccaceae bacterium 1502E]|nr:ChrR family anti-sigma-E factor [Geminicoccaceae bacterium 1502E]